MGLIPLIVIAIVVIALKTILSGAKSRPGGAASPGPIQVPDSFESRSQPPPLPRGPDTAPSPLDELLRQAREEARKRRQEQERRKDGPSSKQPAPFPRPAPQPPRPPQRTPKPPRPRPMPMPVPVAVEAEEPVRRLVTDNTPPVTQAGVVSTTSTGREVHPDAPATAIAAALRRPGFLRNQIILAEVLGRPLALRAEREM